MFMSVDQKYGTCSYAQIRSCTVQRQLHTYTIQISPESTIPVCRAMHINGAYTCVFAIPVVPNSSNVASNTLH